jgi:isoleucyl-tRNA synthetase
VREFVDDLSTWYLRRSRPRFWGETTPDDRQKAHETLSYGLLGLARTIAPLVPFLAEWIFQEVGELGFSDPTGSVHLGPWPAALATRDLELENAMAEVRDLVEVGRELRHRAGVRARMPLPTLVVFEEESAALDRIRAEAMTLLAEELNVRSVVRVPASRRPEYSETEWVIRDDDGVPRAALSRHPTDELLEEGMVREVGRRLQQTRKAMGLRYDDRIRVEIFASGALYAALSRRREALARELLADPLEVTDRPITPGPEVRYWEVDGVTFSAQVARAAP